MRGKSRIASRYWVIGYVVQNLNADKYSKDNLISADKKRVHSLYTLCTLWWVFLLLLGNTAKKNVKK